MKQNGNGSKKRVLLASVCRPFGEKYGDGFGVSYEGTHQLLWAQGIFRPRSTTTQWGIDFIAVNLETPVVTIHYPSMKQFIREISKGYDYVGIAFVVATFHKVKPMVEAVRKYAPGTKIILGGYGTILPDDELLPYSDYICRGEGVAFMRELLGEPTDAPYNQPIIVKQSYIFSLPILARVGYIFAGLGCPHGCDFCVTSHYFKRKHIKLLPTGKSVTEAMQSLMAARPDINSIWISDEDFLVDHKRAREYLEEVRKFDKIPSISIFASINSLSRFTVTELVEMGIDWVWIGFEGKKAGYAKMKGRDYGETFAELKRHGITVMSSMIMGFDYQTEEIIREEFDELMSYNPSLCQFLIYGPAMCTPAHKKYKQDGRLFGIDYRFYDGFYLGFEHPHIDPDTMVRTQRDLYRQEFSRLGPSVCRVVSDWIEGYITLKDHPNPKVRAKGESMGKKAHGALATFPVFKKFFKGPPGVQDNIESLGRKIERCTGPMDFKNRVFSRLLPFAARFTDFRLKHDLFQQPYFSRNVYREKGKSRHQSTPTLPRKWGTVG